MQSAFDQADQFGIPPAIYALCAHTALEIERSCGIEPLELEPLCDGRPGGKLLLYGRRYSYFIVIDCSALPPTLQLSACKLDQVRSFHRPLLIKDACRYSSWLRLAAIIVELEECPPEAIEELSMALQDKMRDGWVMGD